MNVAHLSGGAEATINSAKVLDNFICGDEKGPDTSGGSSPVRHFIESADSTTALVSEIKMPKTCDGSGAGDTNYSMCSLECESIVESLAPPEFSSRYFVKENIQKSG